MGFPWEDHSHGNGNSYGNSCGNGNGKRNPLMKFPWKFPGNSDFHVLVRVFISKWKFPNEISVEIPTGIPIPMFLWVFLFPCTPPCPIVVCEGESCWWTIHPASKQRSEGEKVRVGDDLILVSVASERYLVSRLDSHAFRIIRSP